MKILVLGSGVIGVTSAYYLAKAGHDVTVVDHQGAPGAGDELRECLVRCRRAMRRPWAGPGVPIKAIKWLLMTHGPLVIRADARSGHVRVAPQDAAQLHMARYAVNSRMIPLAEYGAAIGLRALRAEIGIRYDERSQGTLQLFRTQAQVDHTGDDIAVLKDYGVPYEVLDRAGCITAEFKG